MNTEHSFLTEDFQAMKRHFLPHFDIHHGGKFLGACFCSRRGLMLSHRVPPLEVEDSLP